jgi:hypothetical protein
VGFALLGAAVVFLLIVPTVTLVAKATLMFRRRRLRSLLRIGSAGGWTWVVGPVLFPALWFLSGALHQSEPGAALASCLYDHLGSTVCHDALLLAAGIALLLATAFVRRIGPELWGRSARRRRASARSQSRRLSRLCAGHPQLRGLRVSAVRGAADSIRTRGVFRPVVEVDAALVAGLDDDALTAALLHEAEHVRGLDPLRNLVAGVCLSLNPLAWLLRPELARWQLAREAACDRAAVRSGADPMALAEAIVAAARPAAATATACSARLCGPGLGGVRLRVSLLLADSPRARSSVGSQRPLLPIILLILAAVWLPHSAASGPLELIHVGLERALHVLGLG